MYTNFHCCYCLGCVVTYTKLIALYYNVWPEAIFLCETESKGLTNFLVRRCTSSHRNLQLCKIPSCELVWLVSYASLIKEGGEEEEEEEDDEQCGKLHRLI